MPQKIRQIGAVLLVGNAFRIEIFVKEFVCYPRFGQGRLDAAADTVGPSEPFVVGMEDENVVQPLRVM